MKIPSKQGPIAIHGS
jgi:hypothetical protein